ncbi:MAG: helix-turn-helix domain-containing protein [bacterium]
MVQYLTKEEVRQWRSSLEKITLEEFARRLGKEIEENKRTHDIIDMIVNNESVSSTEDISKTKSETEVKAKPKQQAEPKTEEPKQKQSAKVEITLAFSKSLTEREQRVFEYLSENKGKSVKAQDLASVLDIPRDYIYKYIRNLRKKMEEDLLINSDEGGFILNI